MDIEFHQLDLRYESLRRSHARREARLLASLVQIGQQMPVIVVADARGGAHVLVDGYKRVRALRRLRHDTVRATAWSLSEPDALVLERLMRTAEGDSPLDQGWLLRELRDRFALTVEELARRFDRSPSWVSRRLALVSELPEPVQDHVRCGRLVPHAAMKYLVPLARANREACEQLAAAIAPLDASSRQVGELYAAWMDGDAPTRQRVLDDPGLFLRAQAELRRPDPRPHSPAEQFRRDLDALDGIARRAHRRLRQGLARQVAPLVRQELRLCLRQAQADAEQLFSRGQRELADAGPDHPTRDPQVA